MVKSFGIACFMVWFGAFGGREILEFLMMNFDLQRKGLMLLSERQTASFWKLWSLRGFLSLFLQDWVFSLSRVPALRCKEVLSWISPPFGCLKLNFDVAYKRNLGQVGFGCMIQDHYSKVIRVICGPLGICDSVKAEAMALLLGLTDLKKIKVLDCVIDLTTIISWVQGRVMARGVWPLSSMRYGSWFHCCTVSLLMPIEAKMS